MKAWIVKFNGHYPVGACAVVIAPDIKTAVEVLNTDLDYRGLKQAIPLNKFELIDLEITDSHVILDGNY